MEMFDLVVIGAGPGGNYAALTAAKAGAAVAVLEEHEAIGEPVHCGECLSKKACERLGITLPDEVVSREVKGVRLVFPNKVASWINEPGYFMRVCRVKRELAKLRQQPTPEGVGLLLD